MSDITLITPPDIIYNKDFSILLIFPTESIKHQIQEIIVNKKDKFSIYVYDELVNSDSSVKWLLNVFRMVDLCVLDLDNLPPNIKNLESYLISFSKTYYFSKAENSFYKLMSNNKIYNLDQISNNIGDTFELQEDKKEV